MSGSVLFVRLSCGNPNTFMLYEVLGLSLVGDRSRILILGFVVDGGADIVGGI